MPNDNPSPDLTKSLAADPGVTGSLTDRAATTGGPADGTVFPSPLVPATRYELGEEIARGGMGVVYRATDTAFAREVAVKVLQDKFTPTSGTARRFADEARITGQLQHPNIPAVHDLGTLPDGRPFLAMKLIKGETLDDLLKARVHPADDRGRFVAVFEQVCQAVAYAHAHKVIHRDLKPGNVMVGAFGEVQVMDWGLAKVLGTREAESTDPDETTAPTAIQSIRETDSAFTQDGSVLGTPAYMPPEQAIGAIHKVDARSDVFGLGAILAVILTGKPPFVGSSVQTTRLKAAQGDVDECFERLDASGAEPELVALCKRCLSKKAEDRPANAEEVAKAVAALRAAADERARQAETERARAETQAIEQRKRRRVQLALAGVVVLVAVGGGIAAVLVQRQRDIDKLETQAESLVEALRTANTGEVPRLLKEITRVREIARPKLAALAAGPIESKPGLHGRLALMTDDPYYLPAVRAYVPVCRADELLTIRDFLFTSPMLVKSTLTLDEMDAYFSEEGKTRRSESAEFLWSIVLDLDAKSAQRVRAACVLAGHRVNDPRWATVATLLADIVVKSSPDEFVVWAQALEPVRVALLPSLLKRYPESRTRIESGRLAVTDLAAEATAYDLIASLLARYTADRPTELAELAMIADGRHLPLFFDAIQSQHATVASRLEVEIDTIVAQRHQTSLSAAFGSTAGYLATNGMPGVFPPVDELVETLAKRQANAAVVLLRLNQPAKVWPLLKHSPDPRVRSYLIHKLSPLGADAKSVVKQLDEEQDITIRRALLLSLGEFSETELPPAERQALLPKLQSLYRKAPDPGLHAAAEWLLRQWKQEAWLKEVNAEWARASRAASAPGFFPANEASRGASAPGVPPSPPQWFVNTQGQTFVVIPGPVEFRMGAPKSEKDREEREAPHTRRIGRSFAIAAKSVTVQEYRRFNPSYSFTERYAPEPDCPVGGVNWYQAAAYCNWLSEQEQIPKDQWVYEITGPTDIKLKANYLSLTGYRLPTEAEMEYATRAGAVTSRYYGETEELLGRYAWYTKNSSERTWPVGFKKPNDFGLFDSQGNCFTWCQEEYAGYPTAKGDEAVEDTEGELVIISTRSRVLRGGSFLALPSIVRSAYRYYDVPTNRNNNLGFRPARTMPK